MIIIEKPKPGEYDPYTIMYIKLLPDDGRVLDYLRKNSERTVSLLKSLTPEQWMFRYAEGKWTIKEIILHIIDDERIFAYRALRFARNDSTELPGFDQDPYVAASNADDRTPESLIEEFLAVRASTIALFQHLPDDAWVRSGIANGHAVSVRALVYHIAGHELHHFNLIKERYLV